MSTRAMPEGLTPDDFKDLSLSPAASISKQTKTIRHSASPKPTDSTLCFVHRVPPELLLDVFAYCKYFDTDDSNASWWRKPHVAVDDIIDRPWPTMLALSHVCRSWRHVTTAHEFLWTEIFVDRPLWTQLYLQHSGGALVHLSFNPFTPSGFELDANQPADGPQLEAAICTLGALYRVRELDICGPANARALDALFSLGEEAARATFTDGVFINPGENEPDIEIPDALRVLTLRNFDTDEYLRLFHAPLTSLTLSKVFCGQPSERLISPLVEILDRLPTLEHLDVTLPTYEEEDIDTLDDPRGTHSRKASLPALQSLWVQDELPQALSFIESLDLPPNVKLSLISEAWDVYDPDEGMHKNAEQVPSYDSRLHAIFNAQYSEASDAGARFTRLIIMDSDKVQDTVSAIAIIFCYPSSPPLPESVVLHMDCEMYIGSGAESQVLLRLLPSFPPVDGVHTLELYRDMDEDGWKGTSRFMTAITHLTVNSDLTLRSFLRADRASEKPLLPHLECLTLEGCFSFNEWDELRAFLHRRGSDIGRIIQWQSTYAVFQQTREEEQDLLDRMASEGFAPLKWCRPADFEYETVSQQLEDAAALGSRL